VEREGGARHFGQALPVHVGDDLPHNVGAYIAAKASSFRVEVLCC